MKLPLFLLLPLLLPACSALSALGDASQPLDIYELRTPVLRQAATRRPVELVVEEPQASGTLTTERILIRPTPFEAQYLPGIRWADTAPVMMQTLLVRSLTETGALGSVGRRPVGTIGDYAVLSELTDFQAETAEDGKSALVRARMILRLVRERDAQVIATRTFEVSEPVASTDPQPVVATFDRVTTRLLADMAGWIVERAR